MFKRKIAEENQREVCANVYIYIIYIHVYTILYNIHAVRERERVDAHDMFMRCETWKSRPQHPLVPSEDWPAIIPLVDDVSCKTKVIPCASFIPSWLHDNVSATGRNVLSAVTTPGSPQAFLANTMLSGTVPLDRTYQWILCIYIYVKHSPPQKKTTSSDIIGIFCRCIWCDTLKPSMFRSGTAVSIHSSLGQSSETST